MHTTPRTPLTVEAAAHQLSIGRTTVYGLITTSEVESVQDRSATPHPHRHQHAADHQRRMATRACPTTATPKAGAGMTTTSPSAPHQRCDHRPLRSVS